MKITNKTEYSTRHLRKIFIACEKNEGTDYTKRQVEVRYKKGSKVAGYAWYNSYSVVIKLPKPKYKTDIHQLAKVYIHEIGHNLNLRHKEMAHWWDISIDFLEPGDVELRTVASPKKSKAEINEEKVRKKLAEWENKFNRAKLLLKSINKK